MSTRTLGRDLVASWSGVLVILFVWQIIAALDLINPAIFPGPTEVVQAAATKVPISRLLEHISASLLRVVSGFSIGAALGILIGIASGWYRWLGSIVRAPIELIRPIPPLAWIPLALIWFGLGEPSKVFVIFLGAFFPIVTNAYKGMISIDPNLLRAAQTMGLKGWRLLFWVALPASLPDIATGVRIGWSLAFGSLVASEILAANSGLGYMIMHARELGEAGIIIYGIVLISALSLATDFLIRELIFKRQLRWHFGGAQVN